jgi:hypothetical protein
MEAIMAEFGQANPFPDQQQDEESVHPPQPTRFQCFKTFLLIVEPGKSY